MIRHIRFRIHQRINGVATCIQKGQRLMGSSIVGYVAPTMQAAEHSITSILTRNHHSTARPSLLWPSTGPGPNFLQIMRQALRIPMDRTKITRWKGFLVSSQDGRAFLFQILGHHLQRTSVRQALFQWVVRPGQGQVLAWTACHSGSQQVLPWN